MSNAADKQLIDQLLKERDSLYQELSRLRDIDNGALERAQKKNERYEAVINEQQEKIKKLTDQLAWYRHKFWKPASERYIPQDPNQRKIDFDGLDILPQEKAAAEDAQKELIAYERREARKREEKACSSSFAGGSAP